MHFQTTSSHSFSHSFIYSFIHSFFHIFWWVVFQHFLVQLFVFFHQRVCCVGRMLCGIALLLLCVLFWPPIYVAYWKMVPKLVFLCGVVAFMKALCLEDNNITNLYEPRVSLIFFEVSFIRPPFLRPAVGESDILLSLFLSAINSFLCDTFLMGFREGGGLSLLFHSKNRHSILSLKWHFWGLLHYSSFVANHGLHKVPIYVKCTLFLCAYKCFIVKWNIMVYFLHLGIISNGKPLCGDVLAFFGTSFSVF